MAQAPSSASARPATATPATARGSRWRWLLFGLCGGLAFGITHRLLSLQLEAPWRNTQPFGVKATPGTSLEALRQRFGGDGKALRGNLELLELEQQRQHQAHEDAQRLQSLEEQDRLDRERQQRELEQAGPGSLQELPAGSPAPTAEPAPLPPSPALAPPPAPPAPPAPAPLQP